MRTAEWRTTYGRSAAVVVGAILGITAGVAEGTAQPHGPLTTSEQNPLYRWLGTYAVESPDLVDGARAGVATSYSNLFETGVGEGYHHLFDFEQMINAVEVRFRLHEDVEVGAQAAAVTTWGGFLDGFITDFHDFFGFPNGGREQRPDDEHTFRLVVDADEPGEGRSVDLDLPRRSFELEDLRAHVKWRVAGGRFRTGAVSLQGTVRFMAGPFDRGRVDLAGAILGRYSRGPFHFLGQAGASTLSPPDEVASISKETALFYAGGIETALTPGFSIVVQITGSSTYVFDPGPGGLRGPPMNLVVGFAGGSDGGWGWEASFAEDILAKGPSVDFTIDIEISRPL